MKCKVAICSSVGVKKDVNQDNFYVNGFFNKRAKDLVTKGFFTTGKEQILCVFDGMGGQSSGEIASLLATKRLSAYVREHRSIIESFGEHAMAITTAANDAVCEYAKEHRTGTMGATLALLCVSAESGKAVVANIGDSKVYLCREKKLEKLSVDHNSAQRLVDLGMITAEEARTHKEKSKLTQHLGILEEEMIIEPQISKEVELRAHDVFLICSDGLTDMLKDEEIADILSSGDNVKKRCKQLVEKANLAGGDDNTTVIICEIV